MPIYKGGNALKIYKGSYKPVNWYRGAQKVAGWKHETQTGESASFDGTYDDTAEVSVAGNSEQAVTVQGKNLYSGEDITTTYLTFDNTNYPIDSTKYIQIRAYVNGIGRIGARLYDVDDNEITSGITSVGNLLYYNVTLKLWFYSANVTDKVIQAIINSNQGIKKIKIGVYKAGGTEATFQDIMLALNDTSTPIEYEPFVPNSPSPDYPSEVNSTEGNLINGGKNLFDIDYFLSLTGNSTYYEKDSAGNLIQKAPDYRGSYPDLIELPAGTYTMAINTTNWRFLFKRIEAISTYTFTLPSTGYLALKSWAAAGTNLGKVQIERGSEATEYEPFYGYDITTLPILRKIGAVADTWEPETGEVTRRIGVKVFNGTENWSLMAPATYFNYCFAVDFSSNVQTGNQTSKCSHFYNKSFAYSKSQGAYGAYCDHASVKTKYFCTTIDNLTDWKAWLAAQYAAGTPLTLCYQLATPTTESVTPVTIPTYPKTTIIEQDSAIKATIEATAKVADTEPA